MTQNGFSPQCIAMLEQRQVHSHTRTKTKKAKTCIKVTKRCSSEENDKKLNGVGPVDNGLYAQIYFLAFKQATKRWQGNFLIYSC